MLVALTSAKAKAKTDDKPSGGKPGIANKNINKVKVSG